MSLASNLARSVKVELIAKLAASYEAYDGGTLIKNVAPHNVRDYFRKYGSTARKFDQNSDSDVYIGYVRMSGKPEFLSAIVLAGHHAIAVSFDSETDESNDFLTLLAKKEFADRINAAVERAAAFVKQAPPPAPAPERVAAPPPAPSPAPLNVEKTNAMWWILAICLAVVFATIFLTKYFLERVNQPQLAQAGFASQGNYYQPVPQYSDTPSLSENIPQGYEQKGSLIEGGTYGMLDAIMTGVDEANAAFLEDGMWGAESASKTCWEHASSSSTIYDVDRCAAFDMAAQYRDSLGNQTIGTPLSTHFLGSGVRMRQAYDRFSESDARRISVVQGQTAIILRDLSS